MFIAKDRVPSVGNWYNRVPDRWLEYDGAVVWLDAMEFTDAELTHIKELPAWHTE